MIGRYKQLALWPNFLISQYYSGWIFFSHFLLYLRTVLSRINNCIELTWARLTLSYRIDARLIFSLLRQYGSSPVVAVGYRSHCILIGMLTLGSYPEWHRTVGFFFLSLSNRPVKTGLWQSSCRPTWFW